MISPKYWSRVESVNSSEPWPDAWKKLPHDGHWDFQGSYIQSWWGQEAKILYVGFMYKSERSHFCLKHLILRFLNSSCIKRAPYDDQYCFWGPFLSTVENNSSLLLVGTHAMPSHPQTKPKLFPHLLTGHNELTLSSCSWNEGEAA